MRNNKIFFVLIFVFCISGTGLLYAQTDTSDRTPELIPYRKGDKWGYADRNKKIVIPVKYDYADVFRNGRAQVWLNKKTGFLGINGEEIIGIKYEHMLGIFHGNGIAELDKKWGVIDSTGKVIVPFEYDYMQDINMRNSMIAYKDKKPVLILKDGRVFKTDSNSTINNIYEGLFRYCYNGKCGFMNSGFEIVVPLKYDFCQDFSEGRAAVYAYGKWGVIDSLGNEITPLKYDEVHYGFHEGLVGVKLNEKWGFIDTDGNEVIPIKYDWITHNNSFRDGLVGVSKGNKYGVINKEGKEIIPIIYDEPVYFINDLARVGVLINYNTKDWYCKYGFYDTTGKMVIPVKYGYTSYCSEGLLSLPLNGKYGCIDTKGNIVLPFEYEYISEFREGIAKIKKNGKWGYINKYGKIVIPIKYEAFEDHFYSEDGLRMIKRNFKFIGYVDFKGNEYWED